MGSLAIARQFLGKEIEVTIDRPLGSKHPEFDFVYEVNYGYVEGVRVSDGEFLDAYCLGWDMPIKTARGRVVAVIHRQDDDDDKLIVAAPGKSFDDGQIEKAILFQEKYFKYTVIR